MRLDLEKSVGAGSDLPGVPWEQVRQNRKMRELPDVQHGICGQVKKRGIRSEKEKREMKILILNGDDLETKIELKDRFVFLLTKGKRVYHVDSANGQMFIASPKLANLGAAHKKLIAKELK